LDISDLKFMQTRDEKKYYITFIDDCIRYCNIYLLKSNNENLEIFKCYKNKVENQLKKKIKISIQLLDRAKGIPEVSRDLVLYWVKMLGQLKFG